MSTSSKQCKHNSKTFLTFSKKRRHLEVSGRWNLKESKGLDADSDICTDKKLNFQIGTQVFFLSTSNGLSDSQEDFRIELKKKELLLKYLMITI